MNLLTEDATFIAEDSDPYDGFESAQEEPAKIQSTSE